MVSTNLLLTKLQDLLKSQRVDQGKIQHLKSSTKNSRYKFRYIGKNIKFIVPIFMKGGGHTVFSFKSVSLTGDGV